MATLVRSDHQTMKTVCSFHVLYVAHCSHFLCRHSSTRYWFALLRLGCTYVVLVELPLLGGAEPSLCTLY